MSEESLEEAEPVGILTAAYRDKWAIARSKLMEGKKKSTVWNGQTKIRNEKR